MCKATFEYTKTYNHIKLHLVKINHKWQQTLVWQNILLKLGAMSEFSFHNFDKHKNIDLLPALEIENNTHKRNYKAQSVKSYT